MNTAPPVDVWEGMAKSAAHEEALLRALYAEHGDQLLTYVRGLVAGDTRKAEDIVQETLLRAWRHSAKLTAETARPWLFRVARNLVLDGYRASQRRPKEVSASAAGADFDPPKPVDEIERALLAWQVTDALRALSQDHRDVIVELYYRDRTVAEAARILRVPEGTVRSRAYYALRALRLALDEQGVTPR